MATIRKSAVRERVNNPLNIKVHRGTHRLVVVSQNMSMKDGIYSLTMAKSFLVVQSLATYVSRA